MPDLLSRWAAAGARTLHSLVDLVLPGNCGGCDAAVGIGGVCDACLESLAQSPAETRPLPAPEGLPPCVTTGVYDGPLRELILAYKERGRRTLAGPLGYALAAAIVAGLSHADGGAEARRVVVLVPVPATTAAVRARNGDHMLRLASQAERRLRRAGWPISVAPTLRAWPKADSAQLDRHARAVAASSAFSVRSGRADALRAAADAGAQVVLVDDVLTTGATLAAVAGRLADAGVRVAFAATVAATHLRGLDQLAASPEATNWR